MSDVVVTVCCCGALSFLRLGGRKDRSLCHVCAKAAGGSAPGERLGRAAGVVQTRVEWVRTGGGETSGGSGGGRMHKSSLRTGNSGGGGPMAGGGVAVLRPPKPPCWRDFVAQGSARKDHVSAATSAFFTLPDVRTGTDLAGGGGGDGGGGGGGGGGSGGGGGGDPTDSYSVGGVRLTSQLSALGSSSKTAKPSKRVRARIHRTRSEHLIDVEELPEGELTVNLAHTRPRELRMRMRPAAELDERLYVEENNRRCQNWLASIEAAEPLDDIGYTESKDPGEVGLEAVDVEVPEETFSWLGVEEEGEEEEREKGREQLKPPFNTSASSSDSDSLLQHVMAAVGYAASEDDASDDDGEICKLAPRGVGRGANGRGGRGGLRATSSSLNVHKKLSSKHILTISEHSGIE